MADTPDIPQPRENHRLFGHESVEAALHDAFNAGRLHHSLLFAGPRGIGKATLAFRLARFLLKSEASGLLGLDAPAANGFDMSTDDPVFRQVAAGGHPALRVVERSRNPDTGKVVMVAGTHVDIDDLKHIESDLRSATHEAEAANLAKARFISSMSHELRTPLNAILGFAQLMELDSQEKGQPSEHVEEILLASRHLNTLLSDILDWSTIQVDARRVERVPTDVGQIMSESAEMVRLAISEQGLSFEVTPAPEGLTVMADPRRLRQGT